MDEYIEIDEDNFLSHGILTTAQFKELQVAPPSLDIITIKEYRFNNKKIKVFNNKFLSAYDKAKGDISLGQIDDKYKPPMLSLPVAKLPDNYNTLKSVLTVLHVKGSKEIFFPDIHREHLAIFLSFFTIYPDFGPIYEEYISNPDSGIKLTPEVNVMSLQDRGSGLLSEKNIRATVHLLLLFMVDNNISKDADFQKYLENRLMALRNVLNYSEVKFLVSCFKSDEMTFIWNSYPKLKSAIFGLAISLGYEVEISTALMLIAESTLLNIFCIFKFLHYQPKSAAHFTAKIRDETAAFLKACRMLKIKYDIQWPYVRVIKPDDLTLSASKYPNLFRVAIVYVKHFYPSASIDRVAEPNVMVANGLVNAAKIISPNNSYAVGDDIREFTADITKWLAPYEMREALRMNAA